MRRLGLFGSAARGEATDSSDLDFLVELEKKTFDNYMDLKFFLEDLFGCKVDLVMKDALKPRLREPILKETIYAKDYKVYIDDILESIEKIHHYIEGIVI